MKTVLPFETPEEWAHAIPTVCAHLRGGGLLAYPTETVYGLGSRVTDRDIERLAALKGRSKRRPFIILIADLQMAVDRALIIPDAGKALAERFWPGPLTLVLRGGADLPVRLRGSEEGIAVRQSGHAGVTALVRALDEPITSSSANRRGKSVVPNVGGMLDIFASAVAAGTLMVLDGGRLENAVPSTVVDCTRSVPRMIREGAIPRAAVETVTGGLAS
ncbi:MAG TPA: L-threonylcarbamoyladenylate synthase [Gemmatimonadales bacterium]